MRVPVDQGPITLRVLKIDATTPDSFYVLPGVGEGEIKIVKRVPLAPLKVKQSAPGAAAVLLRRNQTAQNSAGCGVAVHTWTIRMMRTRTRV